MAKTKKEKKAKKKAKKEQKEVKPLRNHLFFDLNVAFMFDTKEMDMEQIQRVQGFQKRLLSEAKQLQRYCENNLGAGMDVDYGVSMSTPEEFYVEFDDEL